MATFTRPSPPGRYQENVDVSASPASSARTAADASPPQRITYISWAQDCSRSDHTARELGGRSHMVYAPRFGSRVSTIAFKYAAQWKATARILKEERPDVVFVMTPPVFAALPAFWYAWRHRRQVVLDAHTCAFVLPRWRPFQWLQRMLCRRAVTTLVTNEHIAGLVRTAGGDATLVPDVPVVFPEHGHFARPSAFTVAVVCSFSGDEPLDAIFAAAADLPDVRFFVTGDSASLPAATKESLTANVTLTGFLSTSDYGGLISNADVVMDLTTLDHTMLRGAFEAIYQGVPVIVSDWPVLRDAFPEGAVHVDNTRAAIARAVRDVQAAPQEFKKGAGRLRRLKLERWQWTRRRILARISAHPATDASGRGDDAPSPSPRGVGIATLPAQLSARTVRIGQDLEAHGFAAARRVLDPRDVAIVEGILDPIVLQRSLPALVGLRRDLSDDAVRTTPRQPEVTRPTLVAPSLKQTAVYAACRDLAADLLGCRAHYLFDHAIYKMPWSDTETPWHQDLAYLGRFAGSIRSLHFWIPLQDTSVEGGALRFVPGSHRWALLDHGRAYEHNPHVLQAIRSTDVLSAEAVPLSRGDVSIHTSRTLHASGPNRTAGTRKAWIIHFGDRSAASKHLMKLRNLMLSWP